ncbi:hypothetical protein BTI73_06945 [Lactobacillus delbrueckii subsp. bulgaricus]|nr:hypothetical protein [Lactobacillus delbrueckii subsp. bulgaricus]MBT8924942.1 hypothetical protein [Lactobacillus delbrueckii subsp. bulgaricus]
MDTTESITFTSKLTFWDKFKCFYLLNLYNLISLTRFQKKSQKILVYLLSGSIWLFELNILINYSYLGISSIILALLVISAIIWEPMVTAFIVAIKSPTVLQLMLTSDHSNNLDNGSAIKTCVLGSPIVKFENSVLFDTKKFYLMMYYNYIQNHRVQLEYSIISKRQNAAALSKINFIASVKPIFKKFIKLHI